MLFLLMIFTQTETTSPVLFIEGRYKNLVSLITNQSAEEAATACRQTSEKIRAAIIFFIKKSFFFSTEILYYQSILFLQPSAEIFYYASFDVESNFV